LRVLLALLPPVAAVGIQSRVAGSGVEIVGQEDRPLAVEARARDLAPDAVVLPLEACAAHTLSERIRLAAPESTVILWAAEQEDHMLVIAPGGAGVRDVVGGGWTELLRELLASQSSRPKGVRCPRT
jgi:AmiR/NasT family two-component response regulator